MKRFFLTEKELEILRLAHKEARRKSVSSVYKINAVILLGSGWTIKKVKKVLLLDDETLRGYVEKYQISGIEKLVETNHKERESRLTKLQEEKICEELDAQIHLTTCSVIEFVKNEFDVNYSVSGMKDLLHRLGYEYKKPKLVPGNPDLDAQEGFIKQYETFIQAKPSDAEILFMDAVHPEHNTMAACGWIKRGESRELKTNSARQRLNLHGVINAETHEVTLIESETVDKNSTIQLLEIVEQKYFMASMLYIILDNAKYHYSKEVKPFLKGKKIKLVFLPPYSPNLNLIERLWKFFKKQVIYNKYYENIKEFRKACIKFFKNIEDFSEDIARFMNADFEFKY
jgi:transposase